MDVWPRACARVEGFGGRLVRAFTPRPSRHASRHASRGQRRLVTALTVLVAVPLLLPSAHGAFSASTANGGNAFVAGSTFDTYPQSVLSNTPRFHHRCDDAPSFESNTAAADASGNNRPGTYPRSTDGPATWWRFSEGTGTTIADGSGGANPATFANGGSFGTGVSGGGASLDGNDDFVSGAHAAVRTDQSFTVAAWVYLTDISNHRTVVSQSGGTVAGFFLQYRMGNNWVFNLPNADSTAGGVLVASPAPVQLQRWTHLVGVYDDAADQIRLFVDGALVGTNTRTLDWHAAGSLMAGRGTWNGAPSDPFRGSLDDVRAYPRALTTVEVAEVHGRPSVQWEFEENTGTTVADATGNGATGTLSVATAWTTAGRSGNAALLDGVDDYVTAPVGTVHTTGGLTVSAWVFLTSTATTHKTVFSQAGTSTSAYTLRHDVSGKWAFAGARSDVASPIVDSALGETAPALNVWVHLAGVYDAVNGQLRLYVNGRLDGSAEHATTWAAGGAPTVGRAWRGGTDTDYWPGRIDGFRAYPRPLTNADVAALSTEPTNSYTFDEGSGTELADSSGNNNDGTLSNGASWNPDGHAGAAGFFDGVDDIVTARSGVVTDSSFSVSAWVYLADKSNYRTAVSQDGTAASGFYLQYNLADDMWIFNLPPSDGTTGTWASAKSAVPPVVDRWTHLVGVYDDPNNEVRLYVNGALAPTVGRTVEWAATGPLVLGAARFGGDRADFWSGRLDDVAMYQQALSTAQVSTLHQGSASMAWPFDENTGTTSADTSGHGNVATLVNSGWTTGTRDGNPAGVTFNGTNGYLTSAVSPVATDASFTVSVWTWFNASTVTRTLVSQPGTVANSGSGFELKFDHTSGRWWFVMTRTNGGTADYAASDVVAASDAWSHLVAVHDDPADQLRLYVNGALAGVATHSVEWSAPGALNVGRTRTSGTYGQFYSGNVDDLLTYRRPLPSDEVARLYSGTAVGVTPPLTHTPSLSAGVIGALQGAQQGEQLSTAVAFNGTANAYNNSQVSAPGPIDFTTESWFRTTSATGGQLIGYTNDQAGLVSSQRDRMVYLDSGNRLTFGIVTGGVTRTVRSQAAYNDGTWHHLATSYGPAGLKLYVDGVRVGSDPNYTASLNPAGQFAGFWRWGGGSTAGWPDSPGTGYFTGVLDEVAVYPGQLRDEEISWHYHANH